MFLEEIKPHKNLIKLSLKLRIIGVIFETIIFHYDYSLLVSVFISAIGVTFAYLLTSMIYAFIFALIKSKNLSYRQRYIKASLRIFVLMNIIEFISIIAFCLFVLPKMLLK